MLASAAQFGQDESYVSQEAVETSYEWNHEKISAPPAQASTPAEALQEHHDWAMRMWSRMDRDLSGSITRKELDCEEFRAMVRLVLSPDDPHAGGGGASYERAATNQEKCLDFCLRKADVNGDGRLSFDEFKTFMWALRQEDLEKDTAALIFAMFDLDSDQHIDETEFREIYRFYLGHHPTYEQHCDQWNILCQDQFLVSRERYTQWLQTSADAIFRQHAPAPFAPSASSEAADVGIAPPFSPSASTMSFAEASRRARRIKTNSEGWPLARKLDNNNRPKWNQKWNTLKNPNDELPYGVRNYFSRAHSTPQLSHFYQTYAGFEKHHDALNEELVAKYKPKKLRVLSTDTMDVVNPERHCPSGTMREHVNGAPVGEVKLWEDQFILPARFKSRRNAGDRPIPPHGLFEVTQERIGPWARPADGLPWSSPKGVPWHWSCEPGPGSCAHRSDGKPCVACYHTKNMGNRAAGNRFNRTIG